MTGTKTNTLIGVAVVWLWRGRGLYLQPFLQPWVLVGRRLWHQ
jgi:hypothetical protein